MSLLSMAQKQVYIPRFITNENMDLNDPNSQWCYCRSMETDNFIIFWETGFGADPSQESNPYYVNMDQLKDVAEKSYETYTSVLDFTDDGNSTVDNYKQMIFILYSTEWAAYGSGQDDVVGTLHVNPAAANINTVLAHEIGHCFEYIAGIDGLDGYRYGFGANASGGNGFWEQCANWMSFKVYPAQQFTAHDFNGYITKNHKHILHEEPRYQNYFIQDYWTYKRGTDFMGKLWKESVRPEDPVETYKRLNAISQAQFNDEMYEHAARLTTFDLPAIRDYGANSISKRAQVKMNLTANNFWQVDSTVCIENYGYNSIKLNAPSSAAEVSVNFKGLVGTNGFRALNPNKGGWRYGFVALLEDGTRVYSDMAIGKVENGINPDQTLTFDCPDKCVNLWLVVSGSPQEHWRHAWDDDDSNDEQWPYEVQFTNTDLLGIFNNPIHDETLTYNLTMAPKSSYESTPIVLNVSKISSAFAMTPEEINAALGTSIIYSAINPNGSLNSTSTANAPGHWFGIDNSAVSWGESAFVFSELNITTMVANIGQYPDQCVPGQSFTIKQTLVYTKSQNEKAQVTLIFNVNIEDVLTTTSQVRASDLSISPNPSAGVFNWGASSDFEVYTHSGVLVLQGNGSSVDLSTENAGLYFIRIEDQIFKVMKE